MESIKDLRIRLAVLEEIVGEVKTDQAVTGKALDIASRLLVTLENHIHEVQKSQNKSQTEILLMKQELKGFMSVFKWMFPSFLGLITIIFGVVSLLLTGRLAWG